ncbi:MAG TPA: hypothetical protein VFB43_17975 [Terracidiphilus sp.]|nr:hypothetical protein [Terracidiphilus sp.]
MPVIERPDLAETRAESLNDSITPNTLTSSNDTFGAPKVEIYVYNVAKFGWDSRDGISRPPNHPHLTIAPCPEDQDYVLVGRLQHPYPEIWYDQNNERQVRHVDGYREATKMLSPRNPGIDQNWDAEDGINRFDNLNALGVFWSKHNPPLDSEVKAATARLEKTFRAELVSMNKIERENPQEAPARANKISRAAAEYFGTPRSWHQFDLSARQATGGRVPCPNCAEPIVTGAAVCRHCDAVLDEEKARQFYPDRFKNPVGRPRNTEAAV